jgi:hypothetical protein
MNPYGQKHKITINKIADVQYRVNGDIWINASPAEGFFDSSMEGFVFTVPQLSDGTHTIEVRALNTAGNWETAYSNDTLSIDTHPPISISNLTNINYAAYYINWTWMDPQNTDFDKVMIYLDGIFQTNITNGNQYYNATGLIPATTYEISTRTADLAGNINETWVNRSGTTAPLPDTTAPGSITNLQNITYAWAYINWTWTDPQDTDFDHVDVYLEGVSKGIVMKGTKFYNVTGLSSNTSYTIGLKSVDTSGNLNSSIVTHSARTAPLPDTTSPLGTLNITSFAPLLHVSDNVEATRTFNITINQPVNVAWYINGTEVFNQTGINESSYTNASAAVGTWTINATATNANGTVSHEWTWTVAVYLKGDLNGNGIPADADDLVLMKQASIGEIQANSRYDLNNNGIPADAGDLVLMKRASIGEFQFPEVGGYNESKDDQYQ